MKSGSRSYRGSSDYIFSICNGAWRIVSEDSRNLYRDESLNGLRCVIFLAILAIFLMPSIVRCSPLPIKSIILTKQLKSFIFDAPSGEYFLKKGIIFDCNSVLDLTQYL